MKMSLMLGVMALAPVSLCNAAEARELEFGFYSDAGGSFCDGIQFTAEKGFGSGYHIYNQHYCPYPEGSLAGFRSLIRPLGPGQWFTFPVSQAKGDSLSQAYVLVFYINVKALSWVLYYESTDYDIPFQEANSGVLIKGPPYAMAGPGRKRLGAVITESLVIAESLASPKAWHR